MMSDRLQHERLLLGVSLSGLRRNSGELGPVLILCTHRAVWALPLGSDRIASSFASLSWRHLPEVGFGTAKRRLGELRSRLETGTWLDVVRRVKGFHIWRTSSLADKRPVSLTLVVLLESRRRMVRCRD